MSFHIKRSKTTQYKEAFPQYGGIRSTKWVQPEEGKSLLEVQTTHRPMDLQNVPDEWNFLTPPPHWHWYQDEFFHIKQGRYIFTLEGQTKSISASDPQPVHIPARARHTFKVDDTHPGPCQIEISTKTSPHSPPSEPEAYGINENFFRNIYSYLEDCYAQQVKPSLPQLLLFLDSAEVSIALPGPAWVMRPLSWVLGVVVGRWFGRWVLGYRASYAEYWDEGMEGRKGR